MALKVTINGLERDFDQLAEDSSLTELLAALELRQDRVAVELNGTLCPRQVWPQTPLHNHDRLEIVHFVGGGSIMSATKRPTA